MDGEKREETSEQYEELNPIGKSLMKNIRRDVYKFVNWKLKEL